MKSRGDEMKKSVIITIIVIYVLAIVVVGFIGLKMKVYDEQKYVEKIEVFLMDIKIMIQIQKQDLLKFMLDILDILKKIIKVV